MSTEQTTVSDIFRRAQALARENSQMSLKDLRARLFTEYNNSPMPPMHLLAIPEQDARAPEEDWSAGLSIIRRGIQTENWREIINGILLSLEQTIRYERERGHTGTADEWHDRSVGIRGVTEKGIGKWMPEELIKIAERGRKQ